MKQSLPTPEILPDLVTNNWQLRWQVLEIFNRVRVAIRDHAQGSRPQRDRLDLGRRLAALLHSPEDQNLHLIVAAAHFLGGTSFLFLIFQHLGIDDRDEFYPELSKLKKELNHPDSRYNFLHYFKILLSSEQAVESTTAIAAALAVRLFQPEQVLPLLISIPYPAARTEALHLLNQAHPRFSANHYLFQNEPSLRRHPELIRFITPPLSPEQVTICLELIGDLINEKSPGHVTVALEALGRLQLPEAMKLLERIDEKGFSSNALKARLGDTSACRKLLAEASSWRSRKRCRALDGLAFCEFPEAIAILHKSALKNDARERRVALEALGRNPSPEALSTLVSLLRQCQTTEECRLLLTLLARHPRAGTDAEIADLLADWHDEAELYPQLLEALEVFGYGPRWRKIVAGISPPVTAPHHQEIALFMTRYASFPEIRRDLARLLFDIDWGFSFRLLRLLLPHLQGCHDLQLLLRLLEEREEERSLSISELLTKVSDIPQFDDALCLFLNHHPETTDRLLRLFTNRLLSGELPSPEAIMTRFNQHDPELRKLILGVDRLADTRLETRLPLLYFQDLLQQIELPGSNALAMVVHRTRRYNGFFRQTISTALEHRLESDRELQETRALPLLNRFIDFIRRRPQYDQLREKLLFRLAAIKRRARDLKVFRNVTRDRDLRVIKVIKLSSTPAPDKAAGS
ncbi:MAG: HEAT repeat domain-containing protein [Deltaproteobacteria bacterium]|nr:HEAT repeat domain-containing protein [Deltaproteobacteria bacterium]